MTTETERQPTAVEAKQHRLVAGAPFPDYELSGHDRRRYRLSDVQGIDPMILILSRGHYCPKDFQQHRLLVDFYPQIAVSYTKIVTISTDNIYEANEMRASLGAQWLFLTDPGRKVQKDLGIREYTDPTHDPMIPHTLVLEPGCASTACTTATGSGVALRPTSCGVICARSAAGSGQIGTSAIRRYERTGTATSPSITRTFVENAPRDIEEQRERRRRRVGLRGGGLPDHFDLIVVGSGMGGVSAAGQAAGAGLHVALVERGLLGGT